MTQRRSIYPTTGSVGRTSFPSRVQVYATLCALRLLNERSGTGARYTVFSDSQAAIRICSDRPGPAQPLATASIQLADNMAERQCLATMQWARHTEGLKETRLRTATPRPPPGTELNGATLGAGFGDPALPPQRQAKLTHPHPSPHHY